VTKKRWASEQEKERFMASPRGRAWLERKIATKNARRRDPGPVPERLTRTKFPFAATINDRPCIVWPDFIEYEEEVWQPT
jgi:hypothetical protein